MSYRDAMEEANIRAHAEYTERLRKVTAPQIIRTPAELEALDSDSVLTYGVAVRPAWVLQWSLRHGKLSEKALPAVVVATGEHVRACREALTEDET